MRRSFANGQDVAPRADAARELEHERIHFVLELFRHRWTMRILHRLCLSPTHFTGLHKDLGVSRKVLTTVLRDLERDGLVERHDPEKLGLKGQYALTPRAAELRTHLQTLAAWADRHAEEIEAARVAFARRSRARRRSSVVTSM